MEDLPLNPQGEREQKCWLCNRPMLEDFHHRLDDRDPSNFANLSMLIKNLVYWIYAPDVTEDQAKRVKDQIKKTLICKKTRPKELYLFIMKLLLMDENELKIARNLKAVEFIDLTDESLLEERKLQIAAMLLQGFTLDMNRLNITADDLMRETRLPTHDFGPVFLVGNQKLRNREEPLLSLFLEIIKHTSPHIHQSHLKKAEEEFRRVFNKCLTIEYNPIQRVRDALVVTREALVVAMSKYWFTIFFVLLLTGLHELLHSTIFFSPLPTPNLTHSERVALARNGDTLALRRYRDSQECAQEYENLSQMDTLFSIALVLLAFFIPQLFAPRPRYAHYTLIAIFTIILHYAFVIFYLPDSNNLRKCVLKDV